MPRAEKTTQELKLDLDKITERYERSVQKDNRKIAEVVHKHFGEDIDLKKLDAYFGRIANGFADPAASWSESQAGRVHTVVRKDPLAKEQYVPEAGTAEDDE